MHLNRTVPNMRIVQFNLIHHIFFSVLVTLCFHCIPANAGEAVAIQLKRNVLSEICSSDNSSREQGLSGLMRIAAKGESDDRLWTIAVLRSLQNSELYCSKNSVAIISGKDGYRDGVKLERVGEIGDFKPVLLNQRLRKNIMIARAQVNLFDSNPSVRLSAAKDIEKHSVLADKATVTEALSAEKVGEIRNTLELTLSEIDLGSRDKQVLLKAIVAVADYPTERVHTLLMDLTNEPFVKNDKEIASTLKTSISRVTTWIEISNILAVAYSGLSYGSILLLTSLGLAIIFGLMGVINLAQGEFIMIGAYATYFVEAFFKTHFPSAFDFYLVAAIPIAFVVSAAIGVLMEMSVVRLLYKRPLETLLATWGISIILIKAVELLFGTENVEFVSPSFLTGGITIVGNFIITYNRLFAIVFTAAIFLATFLLIKKTKYGLFIRAATQNRDMAEGVGVSSRQIDRIAFGFGTGLAGLAGLALTQIDNVNPTMGTHYIVDSFMVVVLGGVGNLLGTALAATGIGEINQIIEPIYGSVVAKITILVLIILIIQKRPQGLFSIKGRT